MIQTEFGEELIADFDLSRQSIKYHIAYLAMSQHPVFHKALDVRELPPQDAAALLDEGHKWNYGWAGGWKYHNLHVAQHSSEIFSYGQRAMAALAVAGREVETRFTEAGLDPASMTAPALYRLHFPHTFQSMVYVNPYDILQHINPRILMPATGDVV